MQEILLLTRVFGENIARKWNVWPADYLQVDCFREPFWPFLTLQISACDTAIKTRARQQQLISYFNSDAV